MSPLSAPPISAPIQGDRGITDAWQVYLTKLGAIGAGATKPETVADGNGQTCVVLQIGNFLAYTYTGLGGVTFSFNGNAFTVPASATPQTTSSFVILEG